METDGVTYTVALTAATLVLASVLVGLYFTTAVHSSGSKLYNKTFQHAHAYLRQHLIALAVLERKAHVVNSDQVQPLLTEYRVAIPGSSDGAPEGRRRQGSNAGAEQESRQVGGGLTTPGHLFWKQLKSVEHTLLHLLEDVDNVKVSSLMLSCDFTSFLHDTKPVDKLDYSLPSPLPSPPSDSPLSEESKVLFSKSAIQPLLERFHGADRKKIELQVEMIHQKKLQVAQCMFRLLELLEAEGLLEEKGGTAGTVGGGGGGKQGKARRYWKGRLRGDLKR